MSDANAEVVRRFYTEVLAPGRRDDPNLATVIPQLLDPDVEIEQTTSLVGTAGVFHGYDGLAESAREVFEAFAAVGFELLHLELRGDAVATLFAVRATGRTSGVPVEFQSSHEFRLRNGRIVRWVVHENSTAAFDAIGAEPPPAV